MLWRMATNAAAWMIGQDQAAWLEVRANSANKKDSAGA
jgi:hypothetical protein